MSRTASKYNFVGLADLDSDDDLAASFASQIRKAPTKSNATASASAMAPAKKGKGRTAASKVTKPTREPTRRTSGRIAAAVEHVTGRQALAEKPTNQAPVSSKRGRKAVAKAPEAEAKDADVHGLASPPDSDPPKARTARGGPKATTVVEKPSSSVAATAATDQPVPARRGRKPAAKKNAVAAEREKSPEIPETQQPDAMDVDAEEDTGMQDVTEPSIQETSIGEPSLDTLPIVSSPSKGGRAIFGGDAGETESSVRRRLGDLTKKYDSLEVKYRDLREIGIKEAERNFDRLKKQTEERAKTANDLISKLKAELAAQKELAKLGLKHRKELDAKELEVAALESQMAALEGSLDVAKKEMKTLATRLAASRSAEVPNVIKAPPGSTLKAGIGGAGASRSLGNAEAAAQAAQAAQLKEDLYGDLTGLIIRGVKRNGDEDVYDCIQTGRNGTLHFKLSIGNDMSGENYDETQFMYMPQLDPSRDRALIEVLPDYLVEEISFPRPHAAKFYARVMKSLTERLE